ncbi:MAG TPA: L-seryl-tRNA(Sec) selenium transferase [Chthoniobacterales bacterium]|nr:L-seryl-tRNA(Sec) selenium transferase [Chthoniobacterales bacterium]
MPDKALKESLRKIPSVDKIVGMIGDCDLPRRIVVDVVRHELGRLRAEKKIPNLSGVMSRVRAAIEVFRLAKIQPVINGTGIVIHTNFGRAPLGPAVIESLTAIAANYNNLEYDLSTGQRGHRAIYLERNLSLLCGAEATTVVNNCAAALLLILRHFTAKKKEVVISRGELIQIGGGFRIPEILEASGAKLREVGTTNKTSINDYARALGSDTALILKVHRSNFFMSGFVESPSTEALAKLARTKRIPFVEDLGSGAIVATEKLGEIEHEPTPNEILKSGVDLVCFSGDKLFGGPQSGIIAGKRRHIVALKREPFFRALRCDKLVLTAMQTVVDCYLAGETNEMPPLAMLEITTRELRVRAEALLSQIRGVVLRSSIGEGKAHVGGGSLPRAVIPSVTLDLRPDKISLEDFAARVRRGSPPIVGYIAGGKFKLDLRTIFPRQDAQVVSALRAAAQWS